VREFVRSEDVGGCGEAVQSVSFDGAILVAPISREAPPSVTTFPHGCVFPCGLHIYEGALSFVTVVYFTYRDSL
jgi:hypothetical protein